MPPLEISYREIPLTQGQVALVDIKLFDSLNQHAWFAKWNRLGSSFYAVRNVPDMREGIQRQRIVWMHREVLGLSPDDPREGDHVLHNTLDNRRFVDARVNLRISTRQQNNCNQRVREDSKTGYKGVTKYKHGYRARIRVHGKEIYVGSSHIASNAARMYDAAAKKHFGEFAHLNFPDE